MMLKITRAARQDRIEEMRLEGWLTERTLDGLLAACDGARERGRTVLLDLAGVRFVDAAGAQALGSVAKRGFVLSGCSPFLAEMMRGEPGPAGVPGAAGTARAAHAATVASGAGASAADAAPADAEEERLVAELRTGSEAAFERLVRRQTGPLLAVARRMLSSEEDARDAVQEAFLSAFRSISSFSGGSRLSTWLYRIAVNACLMKLRARRRRPEESIDDLLPRFDESGEWMSPTARWETPAEVLFESREVRAAVRRCVERLPDTHRTILLLRDIEDLDTEETAALLGISPNAVKVRLHRARQALRALLEREGAGTEASLSRRRTSAA